MRLNIKNKYKRLYKRAEAPVPITSDEYGEWEQASQKEKDFSTIESYRLLSSDTENVPVSSPNWKVVYFYSHSWDNPKTVNPWNNIDIPYLIYYYKVIYSEAPINIKTKSLLREIEFYPSGFIKRELTNTLDELDPVTGEIISMGGFENIDYEDGEKVLQF
jgi:hypothetical protein